MGHRSQKNDIGIGYTNFLQVTTFFNYRPSALLVNPFLHYSQQCTCFM